jgi:hypothetical protein
MNAKASFLFLLVLGSLLLPARLPGAALTDIQQAWLKRANRHEKHGWIYLHLEGGPRERGFQHGYLLGKEIAEGIRRNRVSWERQSAMPWAWLLGKADALFTLKIDSENLAEIDGIVEGLQAAGVSSSRAELIAYNGWFELSGYWWPGEFKKLKEGAVTPPVRESCSAFIATGHLTRDGGVVLGHNSMSAYQEALPNVILDVAPERGHRILMQAWSGWIHSGTDFFITDAGLVGAETTLGGFEGFDTNGIPEFARMRRATQDAGSIEAWCRIMKQGNNGGYANAWLLGDVHSGEIARLELGLKHVGFETKRDGFFVGSNVAEDLKLLRFETDDHETDIRKSNVARRVRWKELMSRYAGRIDVGLAKRFEADHYDTYLKKSRAGSRSLCGHFELDPDPVGGWPGAAFGPSGTFDGKVVDTKLAKQMSFAARWGAACGRAFDARRFLAEHPQFDWMAGVLESRPSQPWTTFHSGEK